MASKWDTAVYFVLSKTVGALLAPTNLLAFIGIVGLVLLVTRYRRLGISLIVSAFALLIACGISPLGEIMLIQLENRFPTWTATAQAPTGIVVLGGGIDPDMSAARGEIVGDLSRVVTAARLARRYPNARIIYTGGSANLIGSDIREADFAMQAFEDLGIARTRIEIERDARNTAENAILARAIAAPKEGDRWLLVTSAFHMPRSIGLFRKAGFPVEAVPTDWNTDGSAKFNFASPLAGLGPLNTAAREWLGLGALWLTGKTASIFPAP